MEEKLKLSKCFGTQVSRRAWYRFIFAGRNTGKQNAEII